MIKQEFSRREFVKSTAHTTGAIVAATSLAVPTRAANTNERLRLGFIGVGDIEPRSGGRCQKHIDSAMRLQKETGTVEVASICDVFNRYLEQTAEKIAAGVGTKPKQTRDYRDILSDPTIDAVVIATPDHWHARQTLDALSAGKHVYCEKPMTHSVDEALAVLYAWKKSGLVMQVGVQSSSLPVWQDARRRICEGQLGKVLMYQTEYFRNSDLGQWRYYDLTADMTPKNIDWEMFLGTEFGLAPQMPFDRARFAQWRCYWPFGSGMYTDLFVHRTTSMLLATGLRFPGRVVGAGGLYFEYDGRQVPDVATVVADFPEGVQGLVTATMSCQETPVRQLIRGHNGSFVFGNGEEFAGYDFVAERPQVTHDSSIKSGKIEVGKIANTTFTHFQNFCEAAISGRPDDVNCSPELGAAAMVIVKLGSESYRQGKVFQFDPVAMKILDGSPEWAQRWEKMSENRASPKHVAGWNAGDKGSILFPPDYQSLEGPWINGADPAKQALTGGS